MRKLALILLFVSIAVGLAGAGWASEDNWQLMLRAGVLTDGEWKYSASSLTIGVSPNPVLPAFSPSFMANQIGIYSIDPDPSKRAIRDIRLPSCSAPVWHLVVETGPQWDSSKPITIGWWCPDSSVAPPMWISNCALFRGTEPVAIYHDYGMPGSMIKKAYTFYLDPGVKEDWRFSVTPEPSSLLAMLAGLGGIGVFLKRR